MKINCTTQHFSELTTEQLYNIFRLRLEVFSVEQNCAYQDADGKDFSAHHVIGFDENGKLIAYARILPAGISFKEISIGRVIISNKHRKKGLGKILMKKCLEFITEKFGDYPVRIGAQSYLQKFYTEFGFVLDGKEYLEDNIPHIEMIFYP